MGALHELAARLRRNAATATHGDTAADIRVAAEIIEAVGTMERIEYLGAGKWRDRETKNYISPCDVGLAIRAACGIAGRAEA